MRKLFQRIIRIKSTYILSAFFLIDAFCFSLEQPDLTVIGFFEMTNSIGKQTVELIDTFKDELSIGFVHTQEPKYGDVPPAVAEIAQTQQPLGNVICLFDHIYTPNRTYQNALKKKEEGQILIAYSKFESDAIPEEWVEILNTHFDAVAVPDSYCFTVYEKSGVSIPIFELPIAMDLDPFLSKPLKSAKNKVFTFGYAGSAAERKNLFKLIHAFSIAFPNNPNVRLRINCQELDLAYGLKMKYEIARLNLNNLNVTQLKLQKKSYIELMNSFDCYVSLSKGEGFSLQPREAMALGIPVILPNNSSQVTLCETGIVRSIPSSIPNAYYYAPLKKYSGNVFDCDVMEVAAALKEVVANYSKHLKFSRIAREWVSYYDYNNLKPYYRALIKPKKISLGNDNKLEKDHLITTSSKLYEKYLNLMNYDNIN